MLFLHIGGKKMHYDSLGFDGDFLIYTIEKAGKINEKKIEKIFFLLHRYIEKNKGIPPFGKFKNWDFSPNGEPYNVYLKRKLELKEDIGSIIEVPRSRAYALNKDDVKGTDLSWFVKIRPLPYLSKEILGNLPTIITKLNKRRDEELQRLVLVEREYEYCDDEELRRQRLKRWYNLEDDEIEKGEKFLKEISLI